MSVKNVSAYTRKVSWQDVDCIYHLHDGDDRAINGACIRTIASTSAMASSKIVADLLHSDFKTANGPCIG